MSKLYSMRPKIGLLIFFFAISATALGESAQETALNNDLEFRGQGRANLCYAFSEEQILKDVTCKENCSLNSGKWEFSIFDIARAHQLEWIKQQGRDTIRGDLNRDMMANGSSVVFPYTDVGVSAVRASTCTLEREIFFLNRSKISNPERAELEDFIQELYPKLRSGASIVLPSSDIVLLKPTIDILNALATQSRDATEFLNSVVHYTKCSKQVKIPNVSVHSKTYTDPSRIVSLIEPLLQKHKSLYVGVCAEVLQANSDDGSPCGRHAVVLKNIRPAACASGTIQNCGFEIQVVDSAFFSLLPRNPDGSSWVPESVVAQSISKSAVNFKMILDKALAGLEASQSQVLPASKQAIMSMPGNGIVWVDLL